MVVDLKNYKWLRAHQTLLQTLRERPQDWITGWLVAFSLPWFKILPNVDIVSWFLIGYLYLAWRKKWLIPPQRNLIYLSIIILASTVLSDQLRLSVTTALQFTAVILTVSAVRQSVNFKSIAFLVPSLFLVTYALLLGSPSGVGGNENLSAIISGVLLLLSPTPLALIPAIALFLLKSRATVLALALIAPFTNLPKFILIALIAISVWITLPQFEKQLDPGEGGGGFANRETVWDPPAEYSYWPTGYYTSTQSAIENPHSLFLLWWKELGWILGTLAFALLFVPRKLGVFSALILIIAIFDHWLTTAGAGQFMLAIALTQGDKECTLKERWFSIWKTASGLRLGGLARKEVTPTSTLVQES